MKKRIMSSLFIIAVMVLLTLGIMEKNEEQKLQTYRTTEKNRILTAEGVKRTMNQKETDVYRDGLAAYIRSVNQNVTKEEADAMVDSFMEHSQACGVDEKLVMAVAHTESTYNCEAVSSADYKGLMQTGDILAEEAGYTPQQLFDPAVSIQVGTSYIEEQIETFGDTRLALTAYNQGAGTVYEGSYDTWYADITLERAEAVEAFLVENGYVR